MWRRRRPQSIYRHVLEHVEPGVPGLREGSGWPPEAALQGSSHDRNLLPQIPILRRYSGMLPCFRFGVGSRFVSAVSSAETSTGRVRRGSITSST